VSVVQDPPVVARLEVSGIRKQFPGIVALDDVTLRLRAGEIHAPLGENGAGKSTVIMVLTGLFFSDRILVMRAHAIVGEMSNTHQYEEMSEAIMAQLS
jgi:ABC-type sugar transport system ATPase subunit